MTPAKPRKPVVEVTITGKNGKTYDPSNPWTWTDRMRRESLAAEAQLLLTLTLERDGALGPAQLRWLRDVVAFFKAYPVITTQPAGENEWERLTNPSNRPF